VVTNYKKENNSPLGSIFKEFSFEYQGGLHEGNSPPNEPVRRIDFSPPFEFDYTNNGMPVMAQKVEAIVSQEFMEDMIGLLKSPFKFQRHMFGHTDLTEAPADTSENKNNLFKNSHSFYNLRIPNYEAATDTVEESSLPCFLFGIYNHHYSGSRGERLISKNTLGATFQTTVTPFPTSYTNASFIDNYPSNQLGAGHKYIFDAHGTYDYYNNYYNVYQQNLLADDNFTEQCKSIFSTLPVKKVSVLSRKGTYHTPYYNHIKISDSGHDGYRTKHRITDVLKGLQLSDIIMRRISKTEPERNEGDFIIFNMDNILNIEDVEANKEDYTYLNDSGVSVFNDKDAQAIGFQSDNNIDVNELFDRIDDFYYEMGKILIDNYPTLDDIAHNRPCYNEIIGYRIIKTRAGRSTPVQEFFFAFDNRAALSFIDTQIRLDTEYTYTFYPLYICFEFEVKSTLGGTAGSEAYNQTYTIRPHVKLVHLNIGQFVTNVVEPPPNKPIIKFCNYNNEDNKIKIRLNDRAGRDITPRSRLPLQAISNSDVEYKDKLARYCKSGYPYYSSISSFGVFEIYRINRKPTSISDFDGNLVEIVENDIFDEFGRKRIKNASTVHYLEHGKKYYYLIRALTHRGNYSNPSPVYEVEKIKDADNSILNIKAIKMTPPDITSYSTSFRKFLKISIPEYHLVARAKQGDADADSAFGNNVKLFLGEDDLPDNLWNYNSLTGSHIKLRLESKSTGKKIDFNLIFNYNQPENN